MLTRTRALIIVALLLTSAVPPAAIQSQGVPRVTTPLGYLGANIGDDYFLATYSQFESYWKTLDRESDRLSLVEIGRTEEGRPQWMAIVSAPENMAALDRYRDIARRLALGDIATDDQARALAEQGKTVVWIDGGLHANEVLGAQQLLEMSYQLVSQSDAETLRFLRDTIILLVHANPDGHELVANWYMREPDPRRRSLDDVPRLYQKYVGHDNNRDFYLASQAETINMNRVLYREWFPQIVYNHHQTAPRGTVMFAPPFRDPFNYVFDPLIPVSIDFVGAAMHARFAAERKPGVTMRNGSTYSTWWNGGLRTTAYFHNAIGLLTETIGSPNPIDVPAVPERQIPSADLPFPIAPQRWHFRQSIEYSITANRAVLDVASRYRETVLFNIYRMARNSIERGSRDSWTIAPHRVQGGRPGAAGRVAAGLVSRDPALRDARAYVLPADQPDFLTATKFVDALLKNGVTVHRARAPFSFNGRTYPAGSYVVQTAQAYRPHVLDMFEPQHHPDDIPYPGARPVPPYDNAGWTLAFQMGIKFDRILERLEGPFEVVERARPERGQFLGVSSPAGYLVSHHQNDAFIAVNRVLEAGQSVFWPRDRRLGGSSSGAGVMYIPAGNETRPILQQAAADVGLTFTGVAEAPGGAALRIRPARIALWDRYGGSASSGWIRWLLERYEFPFELAFATNLDAGNLLARYDAIVLPADAVPGADRRAEDAPPGYSSTSGTLSWTRTVPALREFVTQGGTLIAMGSSTLVGERLGIPVSNALVARDARGGERVLSAEEYYVPGSVLRMTVDNTTPLAYGFEREVDVFFDNNPVFRVEPDAPAAAARRVGWFATPSPLRSGWAWGQHHLRGAVTIVDARVGKGRVLLMGPDVAYRAQSHGTFKFLFNALLLSTAEDARLPPRSR